MPKFETSHYAIVFMHTMFAREFRLKNMSIVSSKQHHHVSITVFINQHEYQ